jgi:hypothetical protein
MRDKVGHLEILPDRPSQPTSRRVIFNHLDTYERSSKLLLCNRAAQKSWCHAVLNFT